MRCLILIMVEGGLLEPVAKGLGRFPQLGSNAIPSLASISSRRDADVYLLRPEGSTVGENRVSFVQTLLASQGVDIAGVVPARDELQLSASSSVADLVAGAVRNGAPIFLVCGSDEDAEMGTELGAAAFRVDEGYPGWPSLPEAVRSATRRSVVCRSTRETEILVELTIEGTGKTDIETGLGFFDHMLDQLGRHSGVDLTLRSKGDLHIDEHHTIEDTGITLGQAFREAIGDKRGLSRYAFVLPMDEASASVALDFGGRSWLVWDVPFRRERIGDVPTEMFKHFFKSFADSAGCTLHVAATGENEHHMIESVFKAVGRCLGQACSVADPEGEVPSTKGTL